MSKSDKTIAATAGIGAATVPGSITPPLYASDGYEWENAVTPPAFDYSRSNNPNRAMLLDALSALEGGEGGAITGSGQSAALLALLLLKAGSKIVAPHDCYGGTYRLLAAWADTSGAEVTFVDQRSAEAVSAAIEGGADLFWIETPSNPLLRLVDIAELARQARAAGALVLADNTVMTPCRQKPLALGCDLVLHSTTKAINGHHDLFGGALLAADGELVEKLQWMCNAAGLAASAFDSWQALRGLRTLPLRVGQQEAGARAVAEFLDAHSGVAAVHYPGLATHPDAALAGRQMSGPGGLLSLELAGDGPNAEAFARALEVFTLAPSLGGFSSLCCIPATMTHRGMPPDAQREAGIGPGLIRLSIGLEDPDALVGDLERGLAAIA